MRDEVINKVIKQGLSDTCLNRCATDFTGEKLIGYCNNIGLALSSNRLQNSTN